MNTLPDKPWLFPKEVCEYFHVGKDALKTMGLPFVRISQKLLAIHIDDLRKWESEKRANTGGYKSSAVDRDIPPLSELRPRLNNGKRQSSKNTNEGELENQLRILSGRQ